MSDAVRRGLVAAQPTVRRWLVPLSLWLGLLLLYLATGRGTFYYGDDLSMFQVTSSLIDRWDVALPEPHAPTGAVIGQDGRYYSKYGLGLSLVATPFYQAGSLAYEGIGRYVTAQGRQHFLIFFVDLWTNSIIVATTAVALWLLVRALNFGTNTATVAALTFGVATLAWHYARTFMSEPLTGLCLLVAVAATWRVGPRAGAGWLLLGGFAAGLLVATRTFNVAVLPVLCGYAWWRSRPQTRRLVLWAAPVAAWLLIVATYNLARFGQVTETGYGSEAAAFTTPLLEGVTGLLVTPGKGLVFYSPILLIGLAGSRGLWRRDRTLTLVIGLIAAIFLVGYGRFTIWFGGGSWGPRFLVPVEPLLMLFVAAGFAPMRQHRLTRLLMVALFTLAILIQLGSVLIDFGRYWQTVEAWYQLIPGAREWDFAYRQIYDPVFSPILAHLWLLFQGERWALAGILLESNPLLLLQAIGVVCAIGFLALPVFLMAARRRCVGQCASVADGLPRRVTE